MKFTAEQIQIFRDIPTPAILSKLGIEVKNIRGNDYWYCSPSRPEKTPSFKVNIQRNTSIDFGGDGKQMDNIKLIQQMFHCSFLDACNKLADGFSNQSFSFQKPTLIEEKQSKIQITEVKPLYSYALKGYIQSRGISLSVAERHCKEVHYRNGNSDRDFYAVGFQTVSSSWILRSSVAKLCSGSNYSLTPGTDKTKVIVTEGFMDTLSLFCLYKSIPYGVITLNSLSNISKALPLFDNYKTVVLILDNDAPADKVVQDIISKHPQAVDRRREVLGTYKDINEVLISKK